MINQKRIRTLLRKTENDFITVTKTMAFLKWEKKETKEFLKTLEEQGFIEKTDIKDEYWIVSMRGKVLANKIFIKEFKSSTLEKRLQAFLDRIKEINLSSRYPYAIACAKIISEYPIEDNSNGIKIAYSLCRKKNTKEEYNIICEKLRSESNKTFDTILEIYYYPMTVIAVFLKSASKALKLKEYTEENLAKLDGYVIFEQSTNP